MKNLIVLTLASLSIASTANAHGPTAFNCYLPNPNSENEAFRSEPRLKLAATGKDTARYEIHFMKEIEDTAIMTANEAGDLVNSSGTGL
ncbi:MAG: hypothetical protein V4760_13805, partial [Bdellovibrionota bacterium]